MTTSSSLAVTPSLRGLGASAGMWDWQRRLKGLCAPGKMERFIATWAACPIAFRDELVMATLGALGEARLLHALLDHYPSGIPPALLEKMAENYAPAEWRSFNLDKQTVLLHWLGPHLELPYVSRAVGSYIEALDRPEATPLDKAKMRPLLQTCMNLLVYRLFPHRAEQVAFTTLLLAKTLPEPHAWPVADMDSVRATFVRLADENAFEWTSGRSEARAKEIPGWAQTYQARERALARQTALVQRPACPRSSPRSRV